MTFKIADGSHNPPVKQESGIPMLSARNIGWGEITFSEFRRISRGDFEQERKRVDLQPGDVLLTIVGTLGRAAVVPESAEPFALQRSVAMLRPKDLEPKFVMYQLLSERVQGWLRDSARGSAQQGVYLKTLGTMPILVTSIADQRAIVAEIEKQLTRLDAGVAALRRVQANLKRYRAAVLKAACEGRLVTTESELARKEGRPFEAGANLLGRVLKERRENWRGPGAYKAPGGPNTEGLSPLPLGWAWASVGQAAGTVVDCPHSTAKFVPEGLPCVDTTCIRPGRIVREKLRFVSSATFRQRVERLVPATDDIIFAREGTVGTAVAIPADVQPCLGQRVMLLRSAACITPRYFEACLNSQVVRGQYSSKIVGSTAPHINVAEVKLLAIPLPPLPEQGRIVVELDRRLTVIDELDAAVSANLRRSTRLRQSVLQTAFHPSG